MPQTFLDLMHVKYLGYLQFFPGSVLWLLCHEILPASPIANLRGIGLYVRRFQIRNDAPSKFPLEAFQRLSIFQRRKGYPKLRGKGARVRHVSKAIAKLWSKKMSSHDDNHRRIALMSRLDAEVEHILEEYQPNFGFYALPPQPGMQVRAKQSQIAQLYQQLEEEFATKDTPLFNVVSKPHYSHHILDDASSLHPHLSWCWRGEDFMGVASTLLSSCLRGRSDVQAGVKAIDKYRLAMNLAWKDAN